MKEAIVLLNMGGPNNLNEVELFLENMFNDPNILTMNSTLLRKFIARMITFMRTEASQEIYSQLGGKSPIVGHTEKLVAALQKRFNDEMVVDFVMRLEMHQNHTRYYHKYLFLHCTGYNPMLMLQPVKRLLVI
ncbi:MAG: hypothetical protein DSZ03_03230 [Sulfurimonas sp.]|nr:MAG: hypothetical protein DSZ03_03230 [Sulfurimonas sp.]